MLTLEEFVRTNKQFVVAHRGSSGTAPENTLASFSEAISAGAKMIESDIQLTADGHIVSFHDKGVSRTTNGIGFAGKMNLDEIKKLDAGSWFDKKFSSEKVPTLTEIFDLIRGKAFINIEVKNINCDYEVDGTERILEAVKKADFQEYILFSSFYYNTLKEIKNFDSRYHTAAIRIPKDNTPPSEISKYVSIEAFVCSTDEINEQVSEDCLGNNIYMGVYSIDEADMLDRILPFGVNAIVTNYPARIVNELKLRKLIV